MAGTMATPPERIAMSDHLSPSAAALARFDTLLRDAAAGGRLVQLMLVAYQGGLDDIEALGQQLQRVIARPVQLRGQPHLSLVLRFPTKDITKNLTLDEAWPLLAAWLQDGAFRNAHLFTPTEEVQLAFSKKGKATVRVGKLSNAQASPVTASADASGTVSGAHNRDKHRLLELSRPFLRELGVTDAQGQLVPAMSRKWKQINKFIEIFGAAVRKAGLDAPGTPVRLADFGSGKGYLTFAMHDWLRAQGLAPSVQGVELKQDMVALGNAAAVSVVTNGLPVPAARMMMRFFSRCRRPRRRMYGSATPSMRMADMSRVEQPSDSRASCSASPLMTVASMPM